MGTPIDLRAVESLQHPPSRESRISSATLSRYIVGVVKWAKMALGQSVLLAVMAAGSTGCAGSDHLLRDRVGEQLVAGVVQVLEERLAGRAVRSRQELAALVIDSHDIIAAGPRGVFRPESRAVVPYWGGNQDRADQDALAVAVWALESDPQPFTDDVPRWQVTCAAVSVNRSEAALEFALVRCPTDVVGSAVPDPAARPQLLRAPAPSQRHLTAGTPAATGEPVGPLLPAVSPHERFPCAPEDLRATLEAVSTSIGSTDEARLRVVNNGMLPCALPPASSLSLSMDGRPQPVRPELDPASNPVLAPMESASAVLSWQPGRAPDTFTVQRVGVEISGTTIEVGFAPGLPTVPLPLDDGATVSLARWQRIGYGATPDDAHAPVDVAPPCPTNDLLAQTRHTSHSRVSSAPPSSQVAITNIGAQACRLVPGATSWACPAWS